VGALDGLGVKSATGADVTHESGVGFTVGALVGVADATGAGVGFTVGAVVGGADATVAGVGFTVGAVVGGVVIPGTGASVGADVTGASVVATVGGSITPGSEAIVGATVGAGITPILTTTHLLVLGCWFVAFRYSWCIKGKVPSVCSLHLHSSSIRAAPRTEKLTKWCTYFDFSAVD
jgi:hypothetical protein